MLATILKTERNKQKIPLAFQVFSNLLFLKFKIHMEITKVWLQLRLQPLKKWGIPVNCKQLTAILFK